MKRTEVRNQSITEVVTWQTIFNKFVWVIDMSMSLSAQSQQQDRSCNTCLVSVIIQIRIVLLSSCLPSLYFSAFFSTKTSERSSLPSNCYTVHLQWLVTQGSTIYARCPQHEHLVFMGSAVKARQQIVLRDQLCSSQSFTSRLLGRRLVGFCLLMCSSSSCTPPKYHQLSYTKTLMYTMKAALQTVWKHSDKNSLKVSSFNLKGGKCRKYAKTWHANVWHPKHSLAAVGETLVNKCIWAQLPQTDRTGHLFFIIHQHLFLKLISWLFVASWRSPACQLKLRYTNKLMSNKHQHQFYSHYENHTRFNNLIKMFPCTDC